MDPISTSSYNLSAQKDIDRSGPASVSTSVRSLSGFEKRSLKALLPQIIAACIATCNHIVVGIGLAYSAILIPQLQDKNSDIAVTKDETSWVASVYALISPVGALSSGYIMDRIGRLNTVKISVLPGIIGWILIANSRNIPMLITGRILSGLSASLSTSPAVVYITEIARKDMRGSLLSLGPAYVSLGMVIGYLKGWLISWRTIAWLCNLYIIIPFFLVFLLPESPVWLVSKGRHDQAKNSLNWLHKYQPHPDNESQTFAEMQLNLLIKEEEQKKFEAKMQGGGTFKEFLKPTGYKPLLILAGLFFFQQFSGIYIFLFYSVTFFEAVGTTMNPYISSIWIGVIRLIMSLVNTWMLKYLNRRILIMISASGMGICTLISAFFTMGIKNGTTRLTWVPVVFLLFYVVASMVGLLTIPWTMTAELFPLKIRSLAHSISTSIVNVMLFLAVQNYMNMEVWFGGSAGVQWFFSGISFGAVVYTFVFLPETHKKKLSEIEEYFKHNTVYLGQKKKQKTISMLYKPDSTKNDDKNEIDNLIKK